MHTPPGGVVRVLYHVFINEIDIGKYFGLWMSFFLFHVEMEKTQKETIDNNE